VLLVRVSVLLVRVSVLLVRVSVLLVRVSVLLVRVSVLLWRDLSQPWLTKMMQQAYQQQHVMLLLRVPWVKQAVQLLHLLMKLLPHHAVPASLA
jgi:hypothetical protein